MGLNNPELPSQAGNNGLFLTTNGSTVSWAAAGGTPEWTLIETLTFSSETTKTSSVSFSGYNRLRIVYRLRRASGSGVWNAALRMNGDTGAQYEFVEFEISGGNWVLANNSSQDRILLAAVLDSVTMFGQYESLLSSDVAQRAVTGFNSAGVTNNSAGLSMTISGAYVTDPGVTDVTSATILTSVAVNGTVRIYASTQ